MWRTFRPDALRVWNDAETVRRLRRYRGIIDKERWAKYLLAKDVEFSGDMTTNSEELWSLHQDLSEEHTSYMAAVDSNGVRKSEEERPATSFLDLKIELAQRILQDCHFCERRCSADRTKDEKGWCKLGQESRVSSAFLHTGEEAPLVPSGTIFFSSCCFGCVFCQNEDISTNPSSGRVIEPEELAALAETLHRDGGLNINYVGGDPIPNTHTILGSMKYQQLNVTQLWNSNLYCSIETMKLLGDVFGCQISSMVTMNVDYASRGSRITSPSYREIICLPICTGK
ncbi:MAG: radical SAM protein [Promethearchaeota archaeon]